MLKAGIVLVLVIVAAFGLVGILGGGLQPSHELNALAAVSHSPANVAPVLPLPAMADISGTIDSAHKVALGNQIDLSDGNPMDGMDTQTWTAMLALYRTPTVRYPLLMI